MGGMITLMLYGIRDKKAIGLIIIDQIQTSSIDNLYLWISLFLVAVLMLVGLSAILIYHLLHKRLSLDLKVLLEKPSLEIKKPGDDREYDKDWENRLNKTIEAAGYSYDSKQDIFFSRMDAWQRGMGYCRLYDDASAPLGMIIDCEPIYFDFGGKKWLIELWKGQYDLTTGCEIGVYRTEGPDLDIPGYFTGTFYHCAGNDELLEIEFSLKKNGEKLFKRKDKHWWLTGFKLGEFSEPSELMMKVKITLMNSGMLNAFFKGLLNAGYEAKDLNVDGYTVAFKFDKPHAPQPFTRTLVTDKIIQRKNKLLCDTYQEVTGPYENFPDKIKALKEKEPGIYEKVIKIGKTEALFKAFDKIKDHIESTI